MTSAPRLLGFRSLFLVGGAALLLGVLAYADQEGTLRNHGHGTGAGDGGQLNTLNIQGSFSAPSTATVGGWMVTTDTIKNVGTSQIDVTSATFSSATVKGDMTVQSSFTAGGNMTVNGSGTVEGSLTVNGALAVSQANYVNGVDAGGVKISSQQILGRIGVTVDTFTVLSSMTVFAPVTHRSSVTFESRLILGPRSQTLAYLDRYYDNGWTVVGSTWVGGPGSGTDQTIGATAVNFSGLPNSTSVQYRLTFNIAAANAEVPSIRINQTTNGYTEQTIAISSFVARLGPTAASKCQMTYMPNYGTVFDTVAGKQIAAVAHIQPSLTFAQTLIMVEFLFENAAGFPQRMTHHCTNNFNWISAIELSLNSNNNFVGTASLEIRYAPAP